MATVYPPCSADKRVPTKILGFTSIQNLIIDMCTESVPYFRVTKIHLVCIAHEFSHRLQIKEAVIDMLPSFKQIKSDAAVNSGTQAVTASQHVADMAAALQTLANPEQTLASPGQPDQGGD